MPKRWNELTNKQSCTSAQSFRSHIYIPFNRRNVLTIPVYIFFFSFLFLFSKNRNKAKQYLKRSCNGEIVCRAFSNWFDDFMTTKRYLKCKIRSITEWLILYEFNGQNLSDFPISVICKMAWPFNLFFKLYSVVKTISSWRGTSKTHV